MLLTLLGLLAGLGIAFTHLIFLPYGLVTAFHLPHWVGLGVVLGLVAWLLED